MNNCHVRVVQHNYTVEMGLGECNFGGLTMQEIEMIHLFAIVIESKFQFVTLAT